MPRRVENRRNLPIQAMATADDKQLIERAVALFPQVPRMSVSTFVLEAAKMAAIKVIENHELKEQADGVSR